MKTVSVTHARSARDVAVRVSVADNPWRRLRGLLGRPALGEGQGMLLLGCSSVHTVGMGYPIDVAFLDRDGVVVRTIRGLTPGRLGFGGPGAEHALELPAGRLERTGTVPGTQLHWS